MAPSTIAMYPLGYFAIASVRQRSAAAPDGAMTIGSVLDRQEVQEELGDCRACRPAEAAASPAQACPRQPDDRHPRGDGDRGRDPWRIRRRECERGRHRRGELEERTTRHAALQHRGVEAVIQPGHSACHSRVRSRRRLQPWQPMAIALRHLSRRLDPIHPTGDADEPQVPVRQAQRPLVDTGAPQARRYRPVQSRCGVAPCYGSPGPARGAGAARTRGRRAAGGRCQAASRPPVAPRRCRRPRSRQAVVVAPGRASATQARSAWLVVDLGALESAEKST